MNEALARSKEALHEEVDNNIDTILQSGNRKQLTREVIAEQVAEYNNTLHGIIHTFRLYKDYHFLTPELQGLFRKAIPTLLKHTQSRAQAISNLVNSTSNSILSLSQ